MLDSYDMKDMVKALGALMHPGSHGHVLFSVIQLELWCRDIPLKIKEIRASGRNYSGQSGSGSKENKSLELQPVFDIENFALRYSRVSVDYRLKTATKRAEHSFLVELDIHLCRSEA